MLHVRTPAVAGTFYPAAAAQLRQQVQSLLGQAQAHLPAINPLPKALIVPHAGYQYCGATAAQAFSLLGPYRQGIRRVVLLGPVHHVPVQGLALPRAQAFATPLGEVALDRQAVQRLAQHPAITFSDAAHAFEHALEVQLPFLQTVLETFVLVPLAVGSASAEQVADVLEVVWGGEETVLVISSDLSHGLTYRQACGVDRATVDTMVHGQTELTHQQACGATPINGLLLAARRHHLQARLLDVCNSGDTTGNHAQVVGYAALAFNEEASHVH